tara:strand:+ start:2410 stop:2583 length:174 start_codon:yes stop_codon:yes gene_type:complete
VLRSFSSALSIKKEKGPHEAVPPLEHIIKEMGRRVPPNLATLLILPHTIQEEKGYLS